MGIPHVNFEDNQVVAAVVVFTEQFEKYWWQWRNEHDQQIFIGFNSLISSVTKNIHHVLNVSNNKIK